VDDHVRALTRIFGAGRPGETYVVGGRAERTNVDVVRTVCRVLDELRPCSGGEPYEALIGFVTDRPGHDLRYAIDPSKLERELGWRASHSFEDGIAATVRWYLENEAWWRPILTAAYSGERLGLAGVR
jgi:dTDP-glucose 4,6-dehydratase